MHESSYATRRTATPHEGPFLIPQAATLVYAARIAASTYGDCPALVAILDAAMGALADEELIRSGFAGVNRPTSGDGGEALDDLPRFTSIELVTKGDRVILNAATWEVGVLRLLGDPGVPPLYYQIIGQAPHDARVEIAFTAVAGAPVRLA